MGQVSNIKHFFALNDTGRSQDVTLNAIGIIEITYSRVADLKRPGSARIWDYC